jgi:hypothetical protein
MTAKALYFPYIRTPEDEWFTRALLFWDSVGTIVPGGFTGDRPYVTSRMRELHDEGLLEEVDPLLYLRKVPEFASQFLSYLDLNETVQRKQRQPFSEMTTTGVHMWKLGELAEALEGRGLAQRRVGDGWGLWVEVEEYTADLFMAYLAATLGPLQDVPMDPLTNREQAMVALLGADSRTGSTLKQARNFRLGILEELLPAPAVSIPAQELAKFKRDHEEELVSFRDRVNEELLKVGALVEDDAQQEQAEISRRNLLRERDQIVGLMSRRRWPGIVFGGIAGLVGAATTAAAPFLVGGGLAAAALGAPGMASGSYAAIRGMRTRQHFEGRPMAYAALTHKHFAS